jgi:hypothetical protein
MENLEKENFKELITLVKMGPLAVSFRNKKSHLLVAFVFGL